MPGPRGQRPPGPQGFQGPRFGPRGMGGNFRGPRPGLQFAGPGMPGAVVPGMHPPMRTEPEVFQVGLQVVW